MAFASHDEFVESRYQLYFKRYPYLDRKLVQQFVYDNWYTIGKTGFAWGDDRLEGANSCIRYTTRSRKSITDDEPCRLDPLRDEKAISEILPHIPKDICKMVLSFAVMNSENIIKEIGITLHQNLAYEGVDVSFLTMKNNSIEVHLYERGPRYNNQICLIRLNHRFAKVSKSKSCRKVYFAKTNIKDQAIRAAKMATAIPKGIAMTVQIILEWRCYTM